MACPGPRRLRRSENPPPVARQHPCNSRHANAAPSSPSAAVLVNDILTTHDHMADAAGNVQRWTTLFTEVNFCPVPARPHVSSPARDGKYPRRTPFCADLGQQKRQVFVVVGVLVLVLGVKPSVHAARSGSRRGGSRIDGGRMCAPSPLARALVVVPGGLPGARRQGRRRLRFIFLPCPASCRASLLASMGKIAWPRTWLTKARPTLDQQNTCWIAESVAGRTGRVLRRVA